MTQFQEGLMQFIVGILMMGIGLSGIIYGVLAIFKP